MRTLNNRTGLRPRSLSILLALFLIASFLPTGSFVRVKAEENSVQDTYFYSQLDEESQKFYQAMLEMDKLGLFKTGNGDLDLVEHGYVTKNQIIAYSKGDPTLLNKMGAARDAFQADHPEIFYVDFSYLSLRATKDTSGNYHCYLGTGRTDSYYREGFTSQAQVETAIEEVNQRISELLSGMNEAVASDSENLIAKQVQYLHNQIVNTTSYRMEGVCEAGNEGFIRCVYGPLVKGQAVCEGYARTMKLLLDRAGIPCIQVQGIVRWSDDVSEAHMWNYVQIDGDWYGLDATWDDPVDPSGKADTQGIDGYENEAYLLASGPIMDVAHVPSGILSSVGYTFSYPDLCLKELGFSSVTDDRGLTVQYKKDGKYEDLETGVFKVSFKGMGYEKAAENGYYILGRFYQLDSSTGEYFNGGWGYLNPDLYGASDMLVDTDTEITLKMPHVPYMEFAVTTTPPTTTGTFDDYYYKADTPIFEAQSGLLQNEKGTYVCPPYVESITPTTQGRLIIGKTYPVTAVFDDSLMTVDGQDISVTISSNGTTGAEYAQVTNVQWDGDRTVSFDFTPSEYFADDSVYYDLQINGLVGVSSGKAPYAIRYVCSHGCQAFAFKSQGYDWNVFGQPALLDNVDFNTTDWSTNDGTEIANQVKDQLMLVTTKPSQTQTDTMNSLIEDTGTEALASETYNINLTLCKSQILKAGDGVRVRVGFPAGYSAADEGVTFKAYHFKKDASGNITGVEEVDCVVTTYGLIITCKDFSPYAVVAVQSDGTEDSSKTVIVSSSTGGKVIGADNGALTLNQDETKNLTIQADEGYQIESVALGSSEIDVTNPTEMSLDLSYDQLSSVDPVLTVRFIAQSVLDKQELSQEYTVTSVPLVRPDAQSVTLSQTAVTLQPGESTSISASVLPSDAEQKISYITSNANIATVDANGTISAVGEGSCVITALSKTDGISADCLVSVGQTVSASLVLNYEKASISIGTSLKLSAKVLPEEIDQSVSYASSSTEVASVDENGLVTAKAEGEAVITATSTATGVSASAVITVLKPNEAVVFTAVPSSEKLEAGSGFDVAVNVSAGSSLNAFDYSLYYDPNQVEVDSINPVTKGSLLPEKASLSVNTATAGEIRFAYAHHESAITQEGTLFTVHFKVKDTASAGSLNLKQAVDNAATAISDQVLLVNLMTTPSVGSDPTADGVSAAEIVVPVHVTGIAVSNKTDSLQKGETYQLQTILTPENADNQNLIYSSSDPAVASVSDTGLIEALSNGSTNIAVRSEDGNYEDSFTLTVKTSVTGVSLEKDAISLYEGQTAKAGASVLPADASNQKLSYTSNNVKVAAVTEDGSIQAVGAGSAVITVTSEDGGFSQKIKVTVLDPKLLIGDVDGDLKINSSDALIVLRAAVREITLTDEQFLRADTKKDGIINSSDALQILRYSVKEITSFE